MSKLSSVLTKILTKLGENSGRKYNEIKKETSISEEKTEKAVNFLKKLNAVEKENKKLKITELGTDILELPKEN